jgi:hypothetical protein
VVWTVRVAKVNVAVVGNNSDAALEAESITMEVEAIWRPRPRKCWWCWTGGRVDAEKYAEDENAKFGLLSPTREASE